MIKPYLLPHGKNIKLKDYDPQDTGGLENSEKLKAEVQNLKEKLENLQDKLIADKKRSLLIVFQGMDCSGKDGVIKKVLSSINPQGFQVTSFKKPSEEELSHDFLWRAHKAVPAAGHITAFNRSYYEDVLITRVHGNISNKEVKRRFNHIRNFEQLLVDEQVSVVKIFLHISKDFQIEKINDRLTNPKKKWKFDPSDLEERKYWDDYCSAYEDVFRECSSKEAPWYIVPANERWFRDYLVLRIIVKALEKMKLEYPEPSPELETIIRSMKLDPQNRSAALDSANI
ncbi:PPK2 family polyphosphate kinase [Paenibacillus eucommiae]|uniref:PPK2 family polyphosphate:nucleotide phosphotransferase n=1 Tax=Paenibacillus eucommiae TaxID=1355755 RepID=A0ABS4J4N6_9BACL|nr:PPK2 family polyphosphate kinase [Paenibacillus eucommiae]MBP1994790.1 PPK2 family polyphosphate:nucleotide phosphotransferase [Paenibacillus eucommiae]